MNLDTQQRVAENIRYLRNVFGYTQEQVANKLHLHRTTYTLYESGKKLPGADIIVDLADLYHIRVDTILQTNKDKFINDIIFSDRCRGQVLKLVDTFYQLTPFGQGCLLERAAVLLDKQNSEWTSEAKPIA